ELIEIHEPHACSGKLFAELARKWRVPANRQVISPSIHTPAQIQQLLLASADAKLSDDVEDPDFGGVGTLGVGRRTDIYTFIRRMNFHQVALEISRIARRHRLFDCAQTARSKMAECASQTNVRNPPNAINFVDTSRADPRRRINFYKLSALNT